MNLKPIKSEAEYEEALHRLDAIFDAAADTQEGNEAELLSVLIEDYEEKYHPIDAPDPIEALKIRMEKLNLNHKDFVVVTGRKSRVS